MLIALITLALPFVALAQDDICRIKTIVGRPVMDLGDGGAAKDAFLFNPKQLMIDPDGNLIFWDSDNYRVRQASPDGAIRTIAGNGWAGVLKEGTATESPGFFSDVYRTAEGNFLFQTGRAIWRITPDGQVSKVAGRAEISYLSSPDGTPIADAVFGVNSLLARQDSEIQFLEQTTDAWALRRFNANGVLETLARFDGPRLSRLSDFEGKRPSEVRFSRMYNARYSPNGDLYFQNEDALLALGKEGVLRIIAGPVAQELTPFKDGASALATSIYLANFLGFDLTGQPMLAWNTSVFVLEEGVFKERYRLPFGVVDLLATEKGLLVSSNRQIFLESEDGSELVAGAPDAGDAGDGGPPSEARMQYPWAVAGDQVGNVYIAEMNTRLRKASADGVVSTVKASTGILPTRMEVNAEGSIFLGDRIAFRIRRIPLDGGPEVTYQTATSGGFWSRFTLNEQGEILVADSTFSGGAQIVRINSAGQRTLLPYAVLPYSRDGGLARDPSGALIWSFGGTQDYYSLRPDGTAERRKWPAGVFPQDLRIAEDGTTLVLTSQSTLLRISPSGEITKLTSVEPSLTSADAPAVQSWLSSPSISYVSGGRLLIAETTSNRVRVIENATTCRAELPAPVESRPRVSQ